jgi:predicted AAA+ superfamily ATPase
MEDQPAPGARRLIPRDRYVAAVRPFIDQPFIKVLTGIRRSGKSSLLLLLRAELIARGVPPERIIYLNLEALAFSALTTVDVLADDLADRIPAEGQVYLLVDEVQELEGWERLVNSLLAQHGGRVDIYITGSNSRLLSSELATYIAGRYVSFEVSTLSFAEHLAFVQARTGDRPTDLTGEFADYIRRGGFPAMHLGALDHSQVDQAVSDIFASVLLRDTLTRHRIRQPDMLDRVARFALDNVGSLLSAKRVADYFASQHRKVDPETIHSYLRFLEEAFLVGRVRRFDLRGRGQLAVNEKYYAGDHSLVHAVLGYSEGRIAGVLENIVWAELRRRGYEVHVGQTSEREVDFVAQRRDERLYIQVAYLLDASPQTRQREFAPLQAIRDSHPKLVLSLDPLAGGIVDGIRHLSIPDFLLGDQ